MSVQNVYKVCGNLYWQYGYDVGVKTCQLNLRVYNVLYLCISAPLYEAGCSKLLPKVVICINIIRYTCYVYSTGFDPNIMDIRLTYMR